MSGRRNILPRGRHPAGAGPDGEGHVQAPGEHRRHDQNDEHDRHDTFCDGARSFPWVEN
jgi:hypothetical protein